MRFIVVTDAKFGPIRLNIDSIHTWRAKATDTTVQSVIEYASTSLNVEQAPHEIDVLVGQAST